MAVMMLTQAAECNCFNSDFRGGPSGLAAIARP
jgi:hypothetical protein